jgi:CopG antitoxin of type II toxin-antitoxin system
MRARRKAKVDPLPEEFATPEQAGEFWDEHDLTNYLEHTRPVRDTVFRIERRQYLVALEPSLAQRLAEAARQRGISTGALANLWLCERLQQIGSVRNRSKDNARGQTSGT